MADNEIRIKDLTEATSLASGDNFVIDNANSRGTKRFPYSEFLKLVPVIFNEWTAMVGYGQSAIVTHEGKLYRNKKDYTVISTTWQGSSIWEEIKLDSILDDIVANFVSWYDEDTTYSVNDYAIHQYDLYRCTTAGATGTWDSTKWVKTDVISFIKNIVMSNFSAKRITPGYAESVSKGEVYIIKNLMYRAKEDTTTDPLDMSKWETVTVEELLTDLKADVVKDMAYLEWYDDSYYYRGDIVAHDGYIWVCKVDEATYGTFSRSDWKKTYVERWGRDLFFDISSQEMTFSDSEYTLPYSKGDVVYRYYPHPSNDGFQMRFYVAKADYPNGVTEYVASQWDEYYSLSEVVDALNKETNKSVDEALVEGTASGSIASFTDGSTLPMKKLEVAIEPQQDLHGYENPWVGGSGKNLLGVNSRISGKVAQVVYTSDAEYLYLNGTKSGSGYADMTSLTITLGSGTYYIKAFVISGTASNTVELYPFNGTNNLTGNIIGNERTLTLSEEQTFRFRFAIWSDGTVLTNYKIGIVVSKTSNIDKFYPYSNICPISGWDECKVSVSPNRLIGAEWKDGYFINASGQEQSNYLYKYTTTMINVKPSTTYYVQINYQSTDELAISVPYYNNNGEFISRDIVTIFNTIGIQGGQFTTPNNCYGIRVSLPFNSKEWNLQEGASIVADNTYTIDLDGTRYGGKVDLVSGVLTITHEIKVYSGNSSEGWYADGTQSGSTYRMKAADVPNNIKLPPSNADVMSAISNQFIATSADNIFLGNEGIGIHANGGYLTIYSSVYNTNDVSLWKTHLASNPLQLVYELATPLTYQLTPTEVKSLLATNNVFADTGEVLDAVYVRNSDIVINDLIERGGGSEVTITPTLETGTKIADYTIDSESGSLYAPTPVGMTASAPLDITDDNISIDLSDYDTSAEIALTYATQSSLNSTALGITNYVAENYQLKANMSGYQPLLTAGDNITIDSNNVISATGGSSAINYSLSEQDTGLKWVDGRTIYEKTIEYNNTLNTGAYVNIDSSINTTLNDVFFLTNIQWSYSGYIVGGQNTATAGINLTLTPSGISLENQSSVAGSDFKITVRYCKLSDL